MKYQHILNDEILFETDNVSEFMKYLLNDPKAKYDRYRILHDLLDKAGSYSLKLVSANYCKHDWDEGHNNVSKCKKCNKFSA